MQAPRVPILPATRAESGAERPYPVRDGTLRTREIKAWVDLGAYAGESPKTVPVAVEAALGPYRWDAAAIDVSGIYTNNSPREAIDSEALHSIGEIQIEEIARRCSLDASLLRERTTRFDADLVSDLK